MDKCRRQGRLAKVILITLVAGFSSVGCDSRFQSDSAVKTDTLFHTAEHKQKKAQARRDSLSKTLVGNRDDNLPTLLRVPNNPVRAIYVSSYVANSRRINDLIKLVDQTELNAMVLDINSGISLSTPLRAGNKISFTPSNRKSAKHFREVIQQLKQHRIYLIARIVTFKNPELTKAMPAWALKCKDGRIWRDRSGIPWIDPYRQEAWDYTLALGDHAARIGFDEIQYDYIRFPENATKVDREVAYVNDHGWSKSEAIRRFLNRAKLHSHKSGTRISADVFGMVGSINGDMGIGQKWDEVVKEVDVISPMIYPSHYSKGMWGIDHPDLSPGSIITRALADTMKHNRKLNQQGIATAKVRPWLQGFTAGWVHPHQKYGAAQIREQIQAARKAGINSYMLWNTSNKYPKITS
jgi:hypothetical protein